MALVNKTFSVNVTPGAMPPIVHVSEYDVGRAYTVSILDEQGNTFTIPTGTTASIEGTLNGSVGFTQSATVSNNQVSFTLSESMTAYSGKAWCKIKLTLNSEPIQTCAFVLAVDRAGVEADTIIGAPGFEQQITDAVDAWLDEHGAVGGGLTDEAKQALLACFENVAWINDDGQTYYDALEDALYPPASLVSISAVFNQGSATIYTTDTLDTLKQYLTVTAHYDNSTTQTVTNYTLSGTLTEGTSTISVSYGGKTTTFNVTVTEPVLIENFTRVSTPTIENGILTSSANGWIETPNAFSGADPWMLTLKLNRPQYASAYEILLNSDGIKLQCSWGGAGVSLYLYGENNVTICSGSYLKEVTSGAWVWLKVGWNGSQYDMGISTDGTNYQFSGNAGIPFTGYNPIAETSALPVKSGKIQIGSSNSVALFDLKETMIEVDGSTWWTPYTNG